jgi:hypothetical protein
MALTFKPAFPQAPRLQYGTAVTANTALDGSGTIVTCFGAGTNGSRIVAIDVGALGTNTATTVRFFVSTDGVSWAYHPGLGGVVPAHTIGAATADGGTLAVIARTDEQDFLDVPAGYKVGFTNAVTLTAGFQAVVAGYDL